MSEQKTKVGGNINRQEIGFRAIKFAKDDDYKRGLTECVRLHRDMVSKMPAQVADTIKAWKRGVRLNYTKHALQRMQEYTNKLSSRKWTDGNHCPGSRPQGSYYIEMTQEEYAYLKDARNLQEHLDSAKVVELGLNENHDICKVSFVLYLHVVCPSLYVDKSMTRCLFFCVSPGGCVKTLNITPGEKQ
jgi:hypothetical protein